MPSTCATGVVYSNLKMGVKSVGESDLEIWIHQDTAKTVKDAARENPIFHKRFGFNDPMANPTASIKQLAVSKMPLGGVLRINTS